MGLITKPNILIETIEIKKDDNDQYGTERILGEWGKNIPIVKIGEYVLGMGDLESFSLKVALNCLPSFTMTVNDEQYLIREGLKNDIDKCVVFIGFSDWYIKFNGKLDKTYSDIGDTNIELTGTIFNDKLFNQEQFIYRNMSISDILKDLTTKTSMGLFTIDNSDINYQVNYCLNPSQNFNKFFDTIIKRYTSNLYSVDCFYFYHVCNIENLKKQPIDKYSLDWKTGEQISEQPIIFKSKDRNISLSTGEEGDQKDYKIAIDYYTLDTNFTGVFYNSSSKYSVRSNTNQRLLKTNESFGVGEKCFNTFNGFEKDKFPFYDERINKLLSGNLIKIRIPTVVYELSPFSVVGLELYLPFTSGRDTKLDEEHSGKKIVIGYTIDYEKNYNNETNHISQTIELI